MRAPILRGGAALGSISLILGCAGCSDLRLGGGQSEPVDWAQSNRTEIENAKPEPEPEIQPFTHFAAGQLFEGKGSLPEAILQYRKAVDLKPDFVLAYNRLGICLNKCSRFQEAERCFSQALQHAPDAAYLHNNLGFSFMLQKRWSEASEPLEQALRVQPEFNRARVNLGMTLAQLGQETAAMEQFERAVGTARAYYNLGLVYRNQGRVPEARRAFERAHELDPQLQRVQEHLEELAAQESARVSAAPALPAEPALDAAPARSMASFPSSDRETDVILDTRGVVDLVEADFTEAGAGQTVPVVREDSLLAQLRDSLRLAWQRQRQALSDASISPDTASGAHPGSTGP